MYSLFQGTFKTKTKRQEKALAEFTERGYLLYLGLSSKGGGEGGRQEQKATDIGSINAEDGDQEERNRNRLPGGACSIIRETVKNAQLNQTSGTQTENSSICLYKIRIRLD